MSAAERRLVSLSSYERPTCASIDTHQTDIQPATRRLRHTQRAITTATHGGRASVRYGARLALKCGQKSRSDNDRWRSLKRSCSQQGGACQTTPLPTGETRPRITEWAMLVKRHPAHGRTAPRITERPVLVKRHPSHGRHPHPPFPRPYTYPHPRTLPARAFAMHRRWDISPACRLRAAEITFHASCRHSQSGRATNGISRRPTGTATRRGQQHDSRVHSATPACR